MSRTELRDRLPTILRNAWLCGAGFLAIATVPASAADFPVCPPPAAGEAVRSACRPWDAAAVVKILDDLTIDHLFKRELPGFERTWTQLVTPLQSKNLVESEAFQKLARDLEPLRFTQLDRTTGTLSSHLASAPRQADVDALGFGEAVRLHVRFPETLDGGYWRGPDALQVAFWEKYRLALTVTRGDTVLAGGEVACLSLSPDGMFVRFAGKESAPLFVRVRDCEVP
jgi:hypothetical protein